MKVHYSTWITLLYKCTRVQHLYRRSTDTAGDSNFPPNLRNGHQNQVSQLGGPDLGTWRILVSAMFFCTKSWWHNLYSINLERSKALRYKVAYCDSRSSNHGQHISERLVLKCCVMRYQGSILTSFNVIVVSANQFLDCHFQKC